MLLRSVSECKRAVQVEGHSVNGRSVYCTWAGALLRARHGSSNARVYAGYLSDAIACQGRVRAHGPLGGPTVH